MSCDRPLGLEKSWIPDRDVTATSLKGLDYDPGQGRLHGGRAWSPAKNNVSEVLQIHFTTRVNITGIAMQGDNRSDSWVKHYTLAFSDDTVHWSRDDEVREWPLCMMMSHFVLHIHQVEAWW